MKTALKAAEFWVGVGGAVWKPAKPVSARKLEKQGSSVVSSELCYRVLTGTRARIWVNKEMPEVKKICDAFIDLNIYS